MDVAKVIHIVSSSATSFEDAVVQGIAKASQTLHGITGAKIRDMTVSVENQQIARYKVTLDVAFHVED